MCVSHRDDATTISARCPDETDPAIFQITPDAIASFAVVFAVILDFDIIASKDMHRFGHVDSAFFDHFEPFGFVVLDLDIVQRSLRLKFASLAFFSFRQGAGTQYLM